jgi:protein-disulfide isomerase/uncharacterized membrane protein
MTEPNPAVRTSVPLFIRLMGTALLVLGLAATAALVLQHVADLGLPGCGAEGACAQAAASRWGSVRGWPVSFLGLAYFAGLAVAWMEQGRAGVDASLRQIARVGALVSVLYLVVIAASGHRCLYCLVTHGANLAFWLSVERTPRTAFSPYTAIAFGVIFGVTSVASAAVEWRSGVVAARETERELRESIDLIVRSAGRPAGGQDLTGRHRLGPEHAPVRLVIFSDYQCPGCQRIDLEVRDLLARRNDLSVSTRHFPLNPNCNAATVHNTHPNACRAALMAEAAGLLGGEDAFWRMHSWLFDRGGDFTDAELQSGLRELGFDDAGTFLKTMGEEPARRRVREDIEQGRAFGVASTPTILVNGVELRGWNAPRGVERAVRAAAGVSP